MTSSTVSSFRGRHVTRTQRLTPHHVPAGHRGPLVGIKRQVEVPHEHFALARLGQGLLHDTEVSRVRDTNQ
jgi:hypothetical protein